MLRKIQRKIYIYKGGRNVDKNIIIGATTLLGDLMMSAPLICAVRDKYPKSHITLLVRRNNLEISKLITCVNDVVSYTKDNLNLLFNLSKVKWDIAIINMEGKLVPFFFAVGARNIVSFPNKKGRYSNLINVPVSLPNDVSYLSDIMLKLVGNGKKYDETVTYLKCDNSYKLVDSNNYVVVHVGASKKTKLWPINRYIRICKHIISHDIDVVLTGQGEKESIFASHIFNAVNSNRCRNLANMLRTEQLPSMLSHAAVVIGPDTGVIHIAQAVGSMTIVILGPAQKSLYVPEGSYNHIPLYINGLKCRDKSSVLGYKINGIKTCNRNECIYRDHPCMTGIRENDVINAIDRAITSNQARQSNFI